MRFLLLLLPLWSGAQEISSGPVMDINRLNKLDQSVASLENGRPVYTSTPTFRGGVCFIDGTCQRTAAGALSGSNSFSGNNAFTGTSTITVGGYSNLWVRISSGDFAAVTAATVPVTSLFGASVSSTSYRLEYNLRLLGGTAAFPYMMVAGDNGTNYNYIGRCDNPGANAVPSGTSARFIPLWENATTAQNVFSRGTVEFGSAYSTKHVAFKVHSVQNTNTITWCAIGGNYTASQSASSLTLITNTVNNLSGHWELWQGQAQEP